MPLRSSSRKQDSGRLCSSPISFLLRPANFLWSCLWFRRGLTRECDIYLVCVCAWWLSWNGFYLTILSWLQCSQLLVHLFQPHFFLPLNLLSICLDRELCSRAVAFLCISTNLALQLSLCFLPFTWNFPVKFQLGQSEEVVNDHIGFLHYEVCLQFQQWQQWKWTKTFNPCWCTLPNLELTLTAISGKLL